MTPFFQAVALHQGHLLSPATAQQLYCPQFQALRHPPLSTSNRPPTSLCRPQPQSGDLRHGLSQLQLLCSRQSDQTQWCPIQRRTLLQQQDHREEIAPTGPDDLKQSYKALEALSSVNAFIDRRENLLRAVSLFCCCSICSAHELFPDL